MHSTPEESLQALMQRAEKLETADQLSKLGAAELESLLIRFEGSLWPIVERYARESIKFRHALASVHNMGPHFKDRQALLSELGYWQPVRLSFIAYPEDLLGSRWGSRSIEIDTALDADELSAALYDLAEWVAGQSHMKVEGLTEPHSYPRRGRPD